ELIQSSLALSAPLDIGTLYFYGNGYEAPTRNTVTGSAPISVRTSFQWKEGMEIDGPRTVTINPTAQLQVNGTGINGGYFPRPSGDTLVNKGSNGNLTSFMEMANGALLRNEGTFALGIQANIHQVGTGCSILNVGTLTTDPAYGAPWTIEPPIDNRGTLDLK